MKSFPALIIVLFFASILAIAQEKTLDAKILDLSKNVEKKFPMTGTNYIGVTKLLMEDGTENQLCKYLAEEINKNFENSNVFAPADRDLVLKEFAKNNFNYNNINNQKLLDKISQSLHAVTNVFIENYLFGTVKDYGDIIKINIKIVNVSTGNTIVNFTYDLQSDETTDKLLGKPIRKKAKKVDTVVVVKEKVVTKEVPVTTSNSPISTSDKPNTQVKQVETSQNTGTIFPLSKKIDTFTFTLLDCYYDGGKVEIPFTFINDTDAEEDLSMKISYNTRFFSNNGVEYNYGYLEFSNDRYYHTFNKLMPAQIRFNGKLVFESVKSNEKSMQLLEIIVNGKKLSVRDIPISRK